MEIVRVDLNIGDFSGAIEKAVKVLKFGGTIVYPTDTLYGLGSNALDEFPVKQIFRIKGRDFSKPLPILARNMLWVENLAELNPRNKEILEKLWGKNSVRDEYFGKVTVVLPKKEIVPDVLSPGRGTVGIRITNFPFVDQLLKKLGYPIVSTSATISGEDGGRDIKEIIRVFSKQQIKPSLVIDAGVLPESKPSTVLDLCGDEPKILRVGPAKPEQLMKFLEMQSVDKPAQKG